MKGFYERFAKRTQLSILIVHLSLMSFSATYYVSNTGSDSNTGTSTSTPWQTLAKVNSSNFIAGDQILFQKGSTFYGSVTVRNSGLAGNPIILGSYGTGANPIITGFTTVTAWTNKGSNIWESTNAVSTLPICDMVVINGVNTPMGANTPIKSGSVNHDYAPYYLTNPVISIPTENGTINWTGAQIFSRTVYAAKRRNIISQSVSDFTLDGSGYSNTEGFGCFIQNDIRTLNEQNEWYYNPSTKKLSIYSLIQPTSVKVASIDNLITVNASYVTIDGINFSGANANAIYRAVQASVLKGLIVQNCNFSFSGQNAISTRFRYLTIKNNTITDSNQGAIQLSYSYRASVVNNTIQNTGIVRGMMQDLGTSAAIAAEFSDTITIKNNSIVNTGLNGISFYADSILVKNNYIDTYCVELSDGGGIYTYSGAGGITMNNVIITGNICLNGIGSPDGLQPGQSAFHAPGIYLDEWSRNVEVSYNTIANTAEYGIFLNLPSGYINVNHNTIYNANYSDTGMLFYSVSNSSYPTESNRFENNIVVAKNGTQKCLNFYGSTQSNKWTFDSNIYARPIDDFQVVSETLRPILYSGLDNYSTLYYTLDAWKTFSGQDVNSKKSPISIASENDLQFEYNASTTAKTVTLSRPMIDVKGTKYATSVTLQPFTSVVLIKDPNPVQGDVTAPVINSFSIPSTSTSLTVTLSGINATDNVGVTGYIVTESSSVPALTAAGWSASIPTAYTFSSIGSKTLYLWAKDAAGNLSAFKSASVVISSPVASSFTFTGPSSGNVFSTSANFVVTPNNLYTGTITLTASGTGSAGIPAKVLTFSNSATAQSFTITPTVAGSITLAATNSGSLTNPSNITYTANAVVPAAPTSVSASAGNITASVTFSAPVNNGGSEITGYTVTSIPSGGIDINAGSTSLTHNISGLTNGTSYSFTVKAINSVGSSVDSNTSNSVTPASTGSIEYKSICDGSNYNGWTITGKYTRTLSTKVGGDSIVTTYLTVNPKYTVNENITINEGENYNGWLTTGKYTRTLNTVSGCDSIVTTNLTVTVTSGKEGSINYTQTISLKKGNNMVSSNLVPVNSDINVVMKSLIDQGALYKMQDEAGRSLEYWGSYGGWINKIGNLSPTEGYNVNVKFDCSLVISGTPVILPLNIPLTKGWNFISFPQTVTVNAMSVIQTLIDQNKLVKVQDETGKSIEKLKGIGWVNNIGNFIPGKGYKVYVNNNTSLNIQQSYPKSADILAEVNTTEYFRTQFEGNGIGHMNINLIGLNESSLAIGDELAAYDGEICVGALKITAEHLLSGTASLVSSYSTNDQIRNGFTNGDQILIYTWNKNADERTEVHAELLDGTLTFAQNGSVLIEMNNLATATNILSEEVKIDVYPNPCRGNFTVNLNEVPNSDSRIEILDMAGRLILSRQITNQSEVFNLESQVSGLYFVKTIIGSTPIIHKLIVNK